MNNIYSSAFDIDSVDDLDTEIIAENIIEDIKDSISAKWNSESIGKLLDQMMIRTFSTMDAHFRVIEGGKSYI
jgi:transcriptional regulator CtsR